MARTTKVFYLINSLAQGGAERQMAELVRRLPRDLFDPVLALLEDVNAYPHLLPEGQPHYVLKPGMPIRATLRAWLRAERPDIVHSFMEYANLWNRLVAPSVGEPVIVTSVRGPLMHPRYRAVEGLLSRRSDAIVVNSVAIRDELVRCQRVSGARIHVIPNIVDLERFSPVALETRDRVRADLGLAGTTFLVPGRLRLVKDPTAPALAARLLKKRGRLPENVMFLMAGRMDNPTLLRLVSAITRSAGCGRQFRYVGPRDDIADLYAASDWVLLPSLAEGLSNAALEAHASAKPLILSRGANRDAILEDGVTGHQFPTGRFWKLAGVLERAIRTPPERAADMGRLGRQRVERLFDPDEALKAVTDLYGDLLRRTGLRPADDRPARQGSPA